MRVRVGDAEFVILRYWDQGFSIDRDDATRVRGLVDLFDGGQHLSRCLVVASEADEGEVSFDIKRRSVPMDRPAADYVMDDPAVAGLIAKA